MTERDYLKKASQASFLGKLGIYTKLSGPGWIQAAVTLGGGSLVSALYLGVIGGYEFMWLQPLAMLCGIIMLSALSYITLSSEDRPFVAVKKHISPLLAWGWLLATVLANVVYCAAQFSLGTDALQSNLGVAKLNPYVITAVMAIISLSILYTSTKEGKLSRLIDNILKLLVGLVVLSFLGVVITLAIKKQIAWQYLFQGMIPDVGSLLRPTDSYTEVISQAGDYADFWSNHITSNQRGIIISAFGSAVAINMTFLLPYTLKKRGWTKEHRELSRYDLFLGLLIPFILASSFLVIATASQFHANEKGIYSEGAYHDVVDKRLAAEHEGYPAKSDEEKTALRQSLPQADKDLGVMLAKRNTKNLAASLKPFLGKFAEPVFGIGVLAMALSTMLVHMMMNGYAISEAFGAPGQKKLFMLGACIPALSGLLSPLLWSGNPSIKTAISIPAGVMATTLLPIAYLIFILLMNSRNTLKTELPKRRVLINVLMIISTSIATFASIWNLWGKAGSSNSFISIFAYVGIVGIPLLMVFGVLGFLKRNRQNH